MKEKNSRTRNSILNLVTGAGGQVLMSILHFVSRTVFIQVLGASYLGIGGLFQSVLSILSLTELGLDTAINFKLYKPLANHDEKRVRLLMKFYKQAYIVIGCIILVAGLALIPALPHLIKNYDKLGEIGLNAPLVFIMYLLQSVTSYLFFSYRTTIIKTAQKSYVLYIVDFFINILTVAAQIAVLLLTQNYILYLSIIILMNFLMNGINAVIAHKMFPYAFVKEEDSITKEERNEIFKDCGALFVFKISSVVLTATNSLVLSSCMGLAIVGLYSNYSLILTHINRFINKFYISVKAGMGNVYATEDISKSYFVFELMNFATILLKGTSGVGVALCANELIGIWLGEDYIIPQPFPILLGITTLFGGLKINLGQVRNITGAFRQAWMRPVLGVIINIGVSIILCQKIGVCGVIIGTIVADILANFMIDPHIIHKYSFKNYKPVSYYYRKNLLYILILGLIGCIDYYLCKRIILPQPILTFLLHTAICGISVPATFIILYWRTDVCQYLIKKVINGKKKLSQKNNKEK